MPETNIVSDQILNSWKEIARYLNRGVRTVQRWESELGLPVRRPRGKRRSAVIAMRSEIDEWLNRCPLEEREKSELGATAPAQNTHLAEKPPGELGEVSDLIVSSRLLRNDLDRSQRELQESIQRLISSLQTYHMILRELRPKVAQNSEIVEIAETSSRVA